MGRKRDIGWRIDYIVVNEEIKEGIVSCDIRSEIDGSDHCPVEAMLSFDEGERKAEEKEEKEDKDEKEKENKVQYTELSLKLEDKKEAEEIPFVIRNRDRCTPQ